MTYGEAVAAHEAAHAAAMKAHQRPIQLQQPAVCPRSKAPACRLCVKARAA